jgi:exodeoxyribonuclease VII small subunit
MSLENDIIKLDQLVNQVESGSLSLEDSLAIYEQAIILAKECLKTISEKKGKLFELSKDLQSSELTQNESKN